jgi:hypothetical protein
MRLQGKMAVLNISQYTDVMWPLLGKGHPYIHPPLTDSTMNEMKTLNELLLGSLDRSCRFVVRRDVELPRDEEFELGTQLPCQPKAYQTIHRPMSHA